MTEPVRVGEVSHELMARIQTMRGRAVHPASLPPVDEESWAAFTANELRFREAHLGCWPAGTPWADAVRTWLDIDERPVPNLLLLGDVGVGKTHLAFSVARELLRRNLRVRWLPTVELLDGLRPDGGLALEPILTVDVLILDDLGGERPTDWSLERLYLIVNRRWLAGRPTIATSNLGPRDLAGAVGERTWDRLRDGAVAVKLTGESRRG